MRQAAMWVGCLAVVSSMGCQGSAPAPAGSSPTKMAAAGCVDTACTVILKEAGGVCSVEPMQLGIHEDYTVTFVFAGQASEAGVVVITPKPGPRSGITFQNGPPGRIDRGREHPSGKATGPEGARYDYGANFLSQGGPACTIDPVICIKPGGDPVQDDCN